MKRIGLFGGMSEDQRRMLTLALSSIARGSGSDGRGGGSAGGPDIAALLRSRRLKHERERAAEQDAEDPTAPVGPAAERPDKWVKPYAGVRTPSAHDAGAVIDAPGGAGAGTSRQPYTERPGPVRPELLPRRPRAQDAGGAPEAGRPTAAGLASLRPVQRLAQTNAAVARVASDGLAGVAQAYAPGGRGPVYRREAPMGAPPAAAAGPPLKRTSHRPGPRPGEGWPRGEPGEGAFRGGMANREAFSDSVDAVREGAGQVGRQPAAAPPRRPAPTSPGASAGPGDPTAAEAGLRGPQSPAPPTAAEGEWTFDKPKNPKSPLTQWPVLGHYALNAKDKPDEGKPTYGPTVRIDGATGLPRPHWGWDIEASEGAPIVAAGDGVVIAMPQSKSFGSQIVIDHGDGVFTHYAHMQAPSPLRHGAKVRAGQQIGAVGRSGNVPSKGDAHLHFEVRVGGAAPHVAGGATEDPEAYLPLPRRRAPGPRGATR